MSQTQIKGVQIKDEDITNADIADGTIRGTSANTAGTIGEISQGTISTPDLRNGAVDSTKLLTTDSYTVVALTATETVTALNLVITIVATDPVSPVEGQLWYNSTVHQWKGKNNTGIVILG